MNKTTLPPDREGDFEPKITPLMPTKLGDINSINYRVEALAQVKKMSDDIMALQAENGQLRADLHREQDRVVMMVEERDRYRHESLRFRRLAEKLAVKMMNAVLVLDEAKETVQAIDEIAEGATPPTAAIDRLEAEFKGGSQ